MMREDKSISVWQASIIMFVLMFANKVLVLPSLLYEGTKFEAVFIPVLLFVFEFGLLLLFHKLKTTYPSQSFSEILRLKLGQVVAISVFVLITAFFLLKAVLLYNVAYVFFRKLIYKDTNNILFLFCFIPVVNHLACSGLRAMGRTFQLFFPLILFVTIFCLGVGMFGINSKPLLFESNASQFMITTLRHISAFGDSIFIFLIIDKVEIKKRQWKVLYSLTGVSMFMVCLVSLIFILSYTYTSFIHPFALFELMSYVKEFGGLGRIDIISMVLVIMFTYFHLAIYLKAFMLSFSGIFTKISSIYSVISFNILLLLLINYIILNLENTVVYGETFLPYFSIIAFIIIPIVVLLTIFLKNRKREVKRE